MHAVSDGITYSIFSSAACLWTVQPADSIDQTVFEMVDVNKWHTNWAFCGANKVTVVYRTHISLPEFDVLLGVLCCIAWVTWCPSQLHSRLLTRVQALLLYC